jgi:hypothetical protein
MIQTRHNLFETNSSSTHSLVIAPDKDFEKNFNLVLNKDGMIEVDGWDQTSDYVAYGFYEKLAYMLSWMYLRENDNPYWKEDDEPLDDMVYPADNFDSSYEDEYQTILEVIQKHYPQVKGFVLKNIDDISWDHQTMPYESDFVISIWNEEEVEGYLFNDSVKVVVGRD